MQRWPCKSRTARMQRCPCREEGFMSGDDFVNVQFTELGKSLAGDAPLRIHEGPREFVFTAGKSERVTKAFDWERVLKNVTVAGTPLLEIVPDAEEGRASVSASKPASRKTKGE